MYIKYILYLNKLQNKEILISYNNKMTKRKIDEVDTSNEPSNTDNQNLNIVTNKKIKFDINKLIYNELKSISEKLDGIILSINNCILKLDGVTK